jgi:alpha-tubulin suppressor-like RCC1 family protein
MASFNTIPINDIEDFFAYNNLPLPASKEEKYTTAWNLIMNETNIKAPSSISDFVIAYNLGYSNINIPIYKASDIIRSSDKDLIDLAKLLSLSRVDKERIIRILGYLNRLDNDLSVFDIIPLDALGEIFKQLDCNTMLLLCKTSNKIFNFCQNRLVPILRENINQNTRMDLSRYNMNQLINICRRLSKSKRGLINQISAGASSLVLTIDGYVYSFGRNRWGQLGHSDNHDRYIPEIIESLGDFNIIQVSQKEGSSAVLTSYGEVLTFGSNRFGQLGHGDNIDKNIPTMINNLDDVVQISMGKHCLLSLTNDGKVYITGNKYILGDRNITLYPIQVPGLNNIIQISAGDGQLISLGADNKVYVIGSNRHGQLGLGDNVDRNFPTLIPNLNDIILVSSGLSHTLALNKMGQVYAFGSNENGELGLNDIIDRDKPTLIPGLNNIIQVSAGNHFSLVLTNNGKVYAFGLNFFGNLGLGDIDDRLVPTIIPGLDNIICISAGTSDSLVLSADNKVYGFGINQYGELGKDKNIMRNSRTPILIEGLYL